MDMPMWTCLYGAPMPFQRILWAAEQLHRGRFHRG